MPMYSRKQIKAISVLPIKQFLVPTTFLPVLLVALLAGCGSSVKVSNSRSAVIHAGGIKSAQALADTECGKHKRIAKFTQERPEFVFTFDCVE